jgi:hypothetical protein
MRFLGSYTSLPEKSFRRRLNGCLLGGCITPILWLILTIVISVIFFPFDPKWNWTSTSGTPAPPEFRYAMFPASPAVAYYDRADGARVSRLDRAMLNTQDELTNPWISFERSWDKETLWVRRTDLVFDAPSPSREQFIQAACNAYAAAHTNQFARASFHTKPIASGVEVTLQLRPDDNHVEDYVYTIEAGTVKPLRMRRYFGPAIALQSVGTFPIAGLIAAAILIILYGVGKRIQRKRIASKQATPPIQSQDPTS